MKDVAFLALHLPDHAKYLGIDMSTIAGSCGRTILKIVDLVANSKLG